MACDSESKEYEGEKTFPVVTIGEKNYSVGVRFAPKEEELISCYLKPKVMGQPVPTSCILDFDVFTEEPWNLPGDSKDEKYFFTWVKAETHARENRTYFWKLVDNNILMIFNPACDNLMGIRKTYELCQGNIAPLHLKKWKMYEYLITVPKTMITDGYWALYCVSKKNIYADDDSEMDE